MQLIRSLTGIWERSPRLVVAGWLIASFVIGCLGMTAGMETVLPGPSARETLLENPGEQLAFAASIEPHDRLLIVLGNTDLTADAPEFIRARESLHELVRAETAEDGKSVFTGVQTAGHNHFDDDEFFLSADRHQILLKADTRVSIDRSAQALDKLPQELSAWEKTFPDFKVSYLSGGIADDELFDLIGEDLDHSLIYTLPITLLVLRWAFGSFLAACLPLGIALVSLIASLGAAALLSHLSGPINATASQLVVLLVLALGVDYSLFIVSRVREERRAGLGLRDAVAAARTHTGRAVFWSGFTVALSLLGLFLMQDSVLRSMGLVSVTAVIITLAGTLLALPSILLLAGERITTGKTARLSISRHALKRWLILSLRHPVIVILFVSALLSSVAVYATQIKLGSTVQPEFLPASMQSSKAYSTLTKAFPQFGGVDFSIILHGANLGTSESDEHIQSFLDALQELGDDISGPLETFRSDDQTTIRYQFTAKGDGNDPAQRSAMLRIRNEFIPKHLTPAHIVGYLSGTMPFIVDDTARYIKRTPMVFSVVLLLSFTFLLLAFRSIVVPLKAIILNTLSAAASFGILVICFQKFPSTSWHTSVIEGFVPALLFSILFGLSMDYHLLLLSRIREEVARGKPIREAVELGILSTSGAITSAALIMVSVFAVIASLRLPIMKQLGVGLAAAVLLDATLIRSTLLPASMVLLGKWNWYFPKWLSFLPRIHHEDERI